MESRTSTVWVKMKEKKNEWMGLYVGVYKETSIVMATSIFN